MIKIYAFVIWFGAMLPAGLMQVRNEGRGQPGKCFEVFQYTTDALLEKFYTAGDRLWGIYSDSLENRTIQFRELLEVICREDSCLSYKYCFQQFPPPVRVATSADRKVRLFTRDTRLGRSMPEYETFIQYRTENSYSLENGSVLWEDLPTVWFDTIQTVYGNEQTFYLLSGSTQLANLYPCFLMMAIRIEEGKIIREPLFVTEEQKNDNLIVAYRTYHKELPSLLFADETYPRIVYDSVERILYVPQVSETDPEYLDGTVEKYKWDPELQQFICFL